MPNKDQVLPGKDAFRLGLESALTQNNKRIGGMLGVAQIPQAMDKEKGLLGLEPDKEKMQNQILPGLCSRHSSGRTTTYVDVITNNVKGI